MTPPEFLATVALGGNAFPRKLLLLQLAVVVAYSPSEMWSSRMLECRSWASSSPTDTQGPALRSCFE